MTAFSSEWKFMGVVVCLHSSHYCLFLKGVPETLTKKYTRHIIVLKNPDHSQHANSGIKAKALGEITRDEILQKIIFYANRKWKIRTRRSPPHETSEDASSPLLWSSTSWSVANGEACVDAVSIWSCVDDMVVKYKMSHYSTHSHRVTAVTGLLASTLHVGAAMIIAATYGTPRINPGLYHLPQETPPAV